MGLTWPCSDRWFLKMLGVSMGLLNLRLLARESEIGGDLNPSQKIDTLGCKTSLAGLDPSTANLISRNIIDALKQY